MYRGKLQYKRVMHFGRITDFLVLGSVQDSFCPIIFGRPFLRTSGPVIDCKKGKVYVEFNGEPYEFKFSKFSKQPRGTDLPRGPAILKHNLLVEPLGILSQPKEDPGFDCKPLPDTLKY